MDIKDLQPKQGNVEITAEIVSKDDVREFEKFGKAGKVCNAQIKDSTGEMKLTLWNEQIDNVKPGDKVHITNGYVSEWQGEPQLTTGKMGKLEVVKESEKTKEEMTKGPNEEKDKKIYQKSEERLKKIEEKLKEPEYDEEEVKDE